MIKEIEVKGKKYPVKDDFDYVYVKKFRKIIKEYEAGSLADPDEDMIMLFAEAVCPTLKIDKETMAVNNKNLSFGEVKKLVVDLRTIFNDIRSEQVESVLTAGGSEGKNSQEAVEVTT